MASCDIQVVNPSVLSRIESFLNDPSYREVIENSSNYNTRLCIERRLRLPFLDSQTGVAQNHSTLWMNQRERIPGLNEGQLYTYPSKRWRKKRRQYLMHGPILRPSEGSILDPCDLHSISTVENPAAAVPSDDSKDSALKDDSSAKATSQDAWYLDELELSAMEGLDEGDQDSDYDYEETYTKRRKKRGPLGKLPRGSLTVDSPLQKKVTKGPGPGRGRKKGLSYDASDTEKPFSCDLCGARYKTRPGLTYHYTHSHKEKSRAELAAAASSGVSAAVAAPPPNGNQTTTCSTMTNLLSGGGLVSPSTSSSVPAEDDQQPPSSPHNPLPGWTKFQDTYLNYLNTPGGERGRGRTPGTQMGGSSDDLPPMTGPSAEKKGPTVHQEQPVLILEQQNDKERAAPSLYCDFCLGDSTANKKSGQPEELVSCSDCGRSGHPTCLQFTDNMIISVRKYRWQCIECKCCSICGTSDNDDQLLFCDDCDRGYHMYCLVPPLTTPPEGSWSCRLCLIEFHAK